MKQEPTWAERALSAHRLSGHQSITRRPSRRPRPKSLDEVDPEAAGTYEKLGIPLNEQKRLAGRGGGRGVRQRLGGHHLQGEAGRAGHHLLLVLRSGAEASRAGEEVPRLGGAVHRQLLRRAELGGLQRRLVLYVPKGVRCPMELSTYFRINAAEHRPVRAHADRRRRRRVRQLPRRLHRADARREPAARRGGRAGRAGQRADQVLDRAELVSRRQGRQGRHLQLRHQARQVRRA